MERAATSSPTAAVGALRRFTARSATPATRAASVCDLCGLGLADQHQHLIDPVNRRLVCACDACAILFDNPGAKFTRVPRDVRRLATPAFTDAQWEALAIPIGMAFFFISKPLGRIVAMYPGPAGAAESLLPLEAWTEIVPGESPIGSLRPDVEALLVNRVPRHRRETVSDVSDTSDTSDTLHTVAQVSDTSDTTAADYIVPIDLCYRLVGLIRAEWRGFSGGTEAWAAIDRFFADLEARAETMSEVTRA